ncbi:MAG: LytTR family DNA-binding domain-containing protein [Flavobacteriaceae bacterium]
MYKELLLMIFVLCLIGMGLSLYEHFIGTRPISWISLYETVLKTSVIGFFPITALVVFNYTRLLKKHYKEAEKINAYLITHEDDKRSTKSVLISIESNNKSEGFSKEKDSILFLSTLGNYVEIYFEKNGDVKKEILRTTLSRAEKQLSEYTDFYRCHRAFIVNTSKIVSIDGNASGYYLHFQNTDQIVPVSRRNTSVFKKFMSDR